MDSILSHAGGVTICGRRIRDCEVDHADSGLEALCVSGYSDQRLQLIRHLLAAALNMKAGSGTCDEFADCDALCQRWNASAWHLSQCIDALSAYNSSGDTVTAPFDPPGSADSLSCSIASASPCTVLNPSSCNNNSH